MFDLTMSGTGSYSKFTVLKDLTEIMPCDFPTKDDGWGALSEDELHRLLMRIDKISNEIIRPLIHDLAEATLKDPRIEEMMVQRVNYVINDENFLNSSLRKQSYEFGSLYYGRAHIKELHPIKDVLITAIVFKVSREPSAPGFYSPLRVLKELTEIIPSDYPKNEDEWQKLSDDEAHSLLLRIDTISYKIIRPLIKSLSEFKLNYPSIEKKMAERVSYTINYKNFSNTALRKQCSDFDSLYYGRAHIKELHPIKDVLITAIVFKGLRDRLDF